MLVATCCCCHCGGETARTEPPPEEWIIAYWSDLHAACALLERCDYLGGYDADTCASFAPSAEDVRQVLSDRDFSDAVLADCGRAKHQLDRCFRRLSCDQLTDYYDWEPSWCSAAGDAATAFPCGAEACVDASRCDDVDAAIEEALNP